jgi:hypothetical protein
MTIDTHEDKFGLVDAVYLVVLVLIVLALLTGCTTVPSAPEVTEVKVPVPVPCKIDAPVPPAFAVDALPLGSDAWTQMQALRVERLQRQGYESELLAAIEACQ